jgi:formate hydrogenlyase transcriptional activator
MEKDEVRSPSQPWHYKWEPEGAESNKAGNSFVEEHARREVPSRFGRIGREIVGRSPALQAMLEQVKIVAPTDATVLIYGETGTGKELIARAIHSLSSRSEQSAVTISCAAIPSGLLESELFGHEKGAFTGAFARKIGRFESAHRGTLFFDEVGDIPLELQPKLLRVIQEREFERLGSSRAQQVNVRLVAATSRDLAQMVSDGRFRRDLYYRLNVFPIRLPPLRERSGDIPILVRYFVDKFAHQMKKDIEIVPPDVMGSLRRYHWPGNIRELQNIIERAVILTPGKILHLPLTELEHSNGHAVAAVSCAPLKSGTLEECEREYILQALVRTRWLVGGPNGAATILGVKRTTLIGKMQKLGILRTEKQFAQNVESLTAGS